LGASIGPFLSVLLAWTFLLAASIKINSPNIDPNRNTGFDVLECRVDRFAIEIKRKKHI
jgi:hypothetical protein